MPGMVLFSIYDLTECSQQPWEVGIVISILRMKKPRLRECT